MQSSSEFFPHLGFGLGLRVPHYKHIFEHWPAVDWFEIISENFMDTDGRARRNLDKIRAHYPIVMHGIAMSIGTVDPLNSEYLHKLKKLAADIQPAWISDHLCWTGIAHKNSHDLLPVPYTEEALEHIVSRISQVQDFLGRPIALENPSTYLEFKTSHIPEHEFIAEMAKRSGCHLLLDVNNVYVSCFNHRLDPKAYLDALPMDKVVQIHLSGHSNMGTHIIDTHDDHVVDEVWALYRYVVQRMGYAPNTMVEWDGNIPAWDVLYAELGKAKDAAIRAHDELDLPQLATTQERYVANRPLPLAEAQTVMQDAILQGAAMQTNPADWIRAKAEFAPKDQLAVYVNAYRFRLYDVTADDFPVLKHYLGEDAFDRLIKDFVNIAQSEHFNVSRYAALLPAFLNRHPLSDPIALEIATLENAISQLMDFQETEALEPADLEGMTAEGLMEYILYPRTALQLFEFAYPINRYYRAVQEDLLPPPPELETSYLAVFRHEDTVWRMDLGKDESMLLQKLFGGMPIGQGLEALPNDQALAEEERLSQLSEWFSRWMRNGLLAKQSQKSPAIERNAA
ncbi:MAG: DUF692 family protein [Rickettsiales bacterium]|nr:DUF692 family protein [Rickettsiales bacterium]